MQNTQGKNFNNQTMQTSQTQSEIPTPSQEELKSYLNAFFNAETDSKMRHYLEQEKALKMLFEAYPHNNKIDEVIIKVASLNSLYGTNIFSIFAVAEHISRIKNIDERLKNGDENLVAQIAGVRISGKDKNFYSFATKFCSFHNDRDFAIYDSFVAKVLAYFQREDKFSKHKFSAESQNNEGLKNYAIFKEVLLEFKKRYKLECNLKELDLYLWQFGKDEKYKDLWRDRSSTKQPK